MGRLIKRIFKLAGLVLLAGIGFTAIIAYRGSWLRDVEPTFAGSCESLELSGSAEDIALDRERGIAYLSLLDRRGLVTGDAVQGTVAKVDLTRRPLTAVTALDSQPAHFRPHGLSLFLDARGNRYLFSLNHPVNRGEEPELVERFVESTPGRFQHLDTFTDPLLLSPNDLAAVGRNQYYVVSDKARGVVGSLLQQLGLGGSPLTYVDNGTADDVLVNIARGGGINVSPDGGTLYVAETDGQRIRVLDRDAITGDVTEVRRIAVDTSPDNVDVAEDGSVWIGAHANTFKLIQHFAAEKPAPSQVRQIRISGDSAEIEDIFLDDGSRISASSVGVSYEDLVLIGSITEKKLLICTREMNG